MQRQLAADAIRLSKTPFFALHLAIPLLGILIFTLYQRVSIYAPDKFAVNYCQVLTVIYPLLAAWLCSVVCEQEAEAGFFFMLGTPARGKVLASNLLYLLASGLAACLLAALGYGVAVVWVRPQFSLSLIFMLQAALVIWGCAIFEYLLHLWLGLRFGRNAGFAVSAVEILLAALMLTGLGEGLWYFVPSAWGARLIGLLARYRQSGETAVLHAIQSGAAIAACITLLAGVLVFLWFHRWEGRRQEG